MTVIAAALLLLAPAGNPIDSPTKLAAAFCATVSSGQEEAAIALFDDRLSAKVQAACRIADAIQKEPGEKGLLGDGLPLTSQPDAIRSCRVANVRTRVARVIYTADTEPPASWSDRLVIRQHADGGYEITDVLYGRTGRDRLSAWLARVIVITPQRDANRDGIK